MLILSSQTAAIASLVVDAVVLFFFSFLFSFFLLNITPNHNAGIFPHWPSMTSQKANSFIGAPVSKKDKLCS